MLKLFSKKGEETDAPSTVETSTEEKKNVDKKKIAIIGGSVLGALLIVFVGFGIFFQSHFFFRSTVNGVKASAASETTMKTRLQDAAKGYDLTVVDSEGDKETLSSDELGLKIDISDKKIKTLLKKQNGFLWVYRLFVPAEYMDDAFPVIPIRWKRMWQNSPV